MRFDAIGMFWEDAPTVKGKRNQTLGPMPNIPETGWRPPTEYPDLSGVAAVAIDTETYDPNLLKTGPGWGRGPDGHVVGVSLAVPDGRRWYYPVRHTIQKELNLDPDTTFRWLKHTLGGRCPKIGANLVYDIGWLMEEGVEVNGPLYDIQYAEALLNSESPSVSLEALAEKYLAAGKETSLLYQWCSDYYGRAVGPKQRANIYRSPVTLAGPYAEADASLPLEIMSKQWPLLETRGAIPVFLMECSLIKLMVKMRMKGAPVNVARAEEAYSEYGADIKRLQEEVKRLVGFEVNANSADSMAKAFDSLGLSYGRTAPSQNFPQGQPSFTASVLEATDHKVAKMLLEQKRREKLRNTFIKGHIIESQVNGRIHCSFNQLKGDKTGARSGRFSSSDPNLQNIPVRTKEGKRLRSMCESHLGHRWRKYDYSQIEYRLLAHHAIGEGADLIRKRYNDDPDTDYHDETIRLIEEMTGIVMQRRPAKTINFGLIYGMSKRELVNRIGDGGEEVYAAYHLGVPFAKATADGASAFADQHGYIETILGRKSDFDSWGPARFDPTAAALPFDQALLQYGKIARAFTHKALNRKLQGGAADIMKKGMQLCYEQGLFDEVGIPLLTVHDELDFEDEGAPEAAWREMAHILETCVPLKVPLKVDLSIGKNWGEAD